jgi:hypothetical protein
MLHPLLIANLIKQFGGLEVVLFTEELGATKISPSIKTRNCKMDERLYTSMAFLQALFGVSTLR